MHKGQKMVKTAATYARVTGYYRPVQAFNKGKQQEFADRSIMAASEVMHYAVA